MDHRTAADFDTAGPPGNTCCDQCPGPCFCFRAKHSALPTLGWHERSICTVAATSRSSKLEILALGTLKTDARPRAVSFRAIKDSTGPGLCTVQAWPAALAPTKVWRARSRWQSWLARTPSTKHLGTPHVSNTCGACRPSGTHYVDGAPCPRVCLQRTMLTLQTARGNCLKMRPRHPRALSY